MVDVVVEAEHLDHMTGFIWSARIAVFVVFEMRRHRDGAGGLQFIRVTAMKVKALI